MLDVEEILNTILLVAAHERLMTKGQMSPRDYVALREDAIERLNRLLNPDQG